MSQNNVLEFVREEDFVEYFIFPSIKSENENEQQQQLLSLLKKVNEIVSSLTHDYLWHKDPFKLIQRTSITSKLNHLISQNGKQFNLIDEKRFHVFIFRHITTTFVWNYTFW